jgi:hypothetical protein
VREPQHLLLTRPCDRCIEETGDTDSARKPTIDSSFDETRREESQRYRHADVALAACLPCGDGVDRRGTGLDFGQPLPSPGDCADELSRLSERIGRASARGEPSGTMTSRRRRCGALLHGTVTTDGVVSPSEA